MMRVDHPLCTENALKKLLPDILCYSGLIIVCILYTKFTFCFLFFGSFVFVFLIRFRYSSLLIICVDWCDFIVHNLRDCVF